MMKKTMAILSLVFAVVMLILSVVMFTNDAGRYTNYEYYGGDAYTGIQNAAADTAVNVKWLNSAVCMGFGSLLLAVSFAFVLVSMHYFSLTTKEEAASATAPATCFQSAPVQDMRPCESCGTMVKANEKYCTNCGHVVSGGAHRTVAVNDGWKCPSCSKVNPNYQTTCACGAKKPR